MSFGISNTPDLLWCIPFHNAPSHIPDDRPHKGKAPPASRFCSSSSGVSVREIRFLPASLLKISRLYALRILPSIVKSLHRGVSFVRWAPALLNTARGFINSFSSPSSLGFKKRSSRKNSCLSKAAARITRTMTEMTVTAASRIFAKREGPAAASPNSGGIKTPCRHGFHRLVYCFRKKMGQKPKQRRQDRLNPMDQPVCAE